MKKCILLILSVLLWLSVSSAGTVRHIVIFAQFQDVPFTYDSTRLSSILDEAGRYFSMQFPADSNIVFEAGPTVSLSRDRSYYGANSLTTGKDQRPGVLFYEACHLADAQVDFSLYDNDADGVVESVFVFVSGGDESQDGIADHIRSHGWNLRDACMSSGDYDKTSLELDGCKLDRYVMLCEFRGDESSYSLAGIGTMCHEYGHVLGLCDLYDTDYELSGGLAKGLWGSTSLMDHGNYNDSMRTPPFLNAIELEMLSLGECVDAVPGTYTLKPISAERRYLRLGTGGKDEYYLLECRDNSLYDRFTGGSGLLIYHIDKREVPAGFSSNQGRIITAKERWEDFNEVNCRPDRECARLVLADSAATDVSGAFFPVAGRDSFGPVSGIRRLPDGSVTFSIFESGVSITAMEVFQDRAVISWTCRDVRMCGVLLDGETKIDSLPPYDKRAGCFATVLTGLEPKTEYELKIIPEIGSPVTLRFETKPYYKSVPPYIYLNGVERNADGSFPAGAKIPLCVYSVPDAMVVEWFFDGVPIEAGADGHYSLRRSGRLKALVRRYNGSSFVIVKNITVR